MPHEAASRASMATDYSAGPLPSETALPTKAQATASSLGSLVRLLARQAAREMFEQSVTNSDCFVDEDRE